MNKSRKILIFTLLICTTLFVSILFTNKVNANSNQDLVYNFDQNFPYADYDSINIDYVNMRHSNTITENFNGTFGFINDVIGQNPNGFTVSETGGTVLVISGYDQHSKIVQLYDNNNGADVDLIRTLDTPQSYGTIEWWWKTDDNSKGSQFTVSNSGTPILSILLDNSKLQYYDGSWHDFSPYKQVFPDLWYHVRIDFECTIGNYKGLSQYDWHVFVDDKHYGDYNFANNENQITSYFYNTGISDNDYHTQIDDIGNSWLNYIVGNNTEPIIEFLDSNILKPDKYEFNLNVSGLPYHFPSDPIIYDWNEVDGNNVYIDAVPPFLPAPYYDMIVAIDSGSGNTGIQNDFNIHRDKINITWSLNFKDTDEISDGYFVLYVDTLDGNSQIRLKIELLTSSTAKIVNIHSNILGYLSDIDNPLNEYQFNLYLDDNFNCILRWYKNSIFEGSSTYSCFKDLKGIDFIGFYGHDGVADSNYLNLRLDSIGIYQYNISLTKESGYLDYQLENDFDSDIYNLFDFYSTDYIKIIIHQWKKFNYYLSYYKELRNYANYPQFFNLYNYDLEVSLPHLAFIVNESIDLNEFYFSLEGIIIHEFYNLLPTYDYIPTYTYAEWVNENHSYCYVDTSNKLNYKLTIDDDNQIEYIEMLIDIANIYNVNRTLHFRGKYNGVGLAWTQIFYVGSTLDSFNLSTNLKTVNYILPHDKGSSAFALIFTDDNNNGYTGFTSEGYIYDLRINFFDAELTLFTLNIIEIMIPIIIITIPTIAIYFVAGKKSIIPMLILMCIICFITDLIPLELFFLIMFCLGCSLFVQYKKSKEVL